MILVAAKPKGKFQNKLFTGAKANHPLLSPDDGDFLYCSRSICSTFAGGVVVEMICSDAATQTMMIGMIVVR
jgi:hypothetical protein